MTKTRSNITYINFLNRKYRKIFGLKDNVVLFYNIDDYVLFLFYDYFNKDEEKYYYRIEEDITEYSNIQQGIKKRNRG